MALWAVALLLGMLGAGWPLVVTRKIATFDSFTALTPFCFFKPSNGFATLEYTLSEERYHTSFAVALLSTDSYGQVGDFLSIDEPCNHKLNRTSNLSRSDLSQNVINVTHFSNDVACFNAVLANCKLKCVGLECQGVLDLVITLVYMSGNDPWSKHLSAVSVVARLTLPLSTGFVILAVYTFKVDFLLEQINRKHPTFSVLKYAVSVNLASYFFFILYYLFYSDSGEAWIFLIIASDILFQISDCLLVLLFMFIAIGWGITSRKIPRQAKPFPASHTPQTRMYIASFFSLYSTVVIVTLIWNYATPEFQINKLYFRSTAGIVRIVAKGVSFVYCCYIAFFNIRSIPVVDPFYKGILLMCGFWFIIDIIVSSVVDEFSLLSRDTTYYIFKFVLQLVFDAVLVIIYNPSIKCSTAYPFHRREDLSLGDNQETIECNEVIQGFSNLNVLIKRATTDAKKLSSLIDDSFQDIEKHGEAIRKRNVQKADRGFHNIIARSFPVADIIDTDNSRGPDSIHRSLSPIGGITGKSAVSFPGPPGSAPQITPVTSSGPPMPYSPHAIGPMLQRTPTPMPQTENSIPVSIAASPHTKSPPGFTPVSSPVHSQLDSKSQGTPELGLLFSASGPVIPNGDSTTAPVHRFSVGPPNAGSSGSSLHRPTAEDTRAPNYGSSSTGPGRRFSLSNSTNGESSILHGAEQHRPRVSTGRDLSPGVGSLLSGERRPPYRHSVNLGRRSSLVSSQTEDVYPNYENVENQYIESKVMGSFERALPLVTGPASSSALTSTSTVGAMSSVLPQEPQIDSQVPSSIFSNAQAHQAFVGGLDNPNTRHVMPAHSSFNESDSSIVGALPRPSIPHDQLDSPGMYSCDSKNTDSQDDKGSPESLIGGASMPRRIATSPLRHESTASDPDSMFSPLSQHEEMESAAESKSDLSNARRAHVGRLEPISLPSSTVMSGPVQNQTAGPNRRWTPPDSTVGATEN